MFIQFIFSQKLKAIKLLGSSQNSVLYRLLFPKEDAVAKRTSPNLLVNFENPYVIFMEVVTLYHISMIYLKKIQQPNTF